MELGFLSNMGIDLDFLSRLVSIVIIDLILAGDNAVLIAMAVRSLPREQRRLGIIVGAGAAILLRVAMTFFVSQLLLISFIKLIGGALILWIAVKLFIQVAPEQGVSDEPATIWEAVKLIVIADISMSLDNMLAVGGASGGSLFLLLFGLALSIPFLIFTSSLLSTLMDRYPVIIYIAAAILGKVGGEMIITDPVVVTYWEPSKVLQYSVEAAFAIGVLVAGKLWIKWRLRSEEPNTEVPLPAIASGSEPADPPEKK
ncbi:MAG: TerC family protein [Desulfomonile tiedjei]|nr:TerC family protein [Desulfomonile tiedjei]